MPTNETETLRIFPAIDLKDGRCVRLRQGRADQATVYGADPVAMARHWRDAGALALHVVDLDGAFTGRPVHTEVIGQIAAALDIPVQVGGGLRTDADVRLLLEQGVQRAIVGTRALDDPEAVARLADTFGPQLAVGIDARDGWVQIKGWVETSRTRATDLALRMASLGVGTLIYTDTTTDGMLCGPNLEAVDALCAAVQCRVVASGGVSRLADISALAALKRPNLEGVIIGKALYEGTVTLPEALAATTGAAHAQ